MRVEKFKSGKIDLLSKIIMENYPTIGYSLIQKLLRKKGKLSKERIELFDYSK